MKKKVDIILTVVGIVGIAILVVGIVVGFIGFCLNSETLFYTGIASTIFFCPAYFILYLIVLFIVAMIEEKEKKK